MKMFDCERVTHMVRLCQRGFVGQAQHRRELSDCVYPISRRDELGHPARLVSDPCDARGAVIDLDQLCGASFSLSVGSFCSVRRIT
jgi:hypothetical protein